MAYLRLFRTLNLVILATTMCLFRYCIVFPLIHQAGIIPVFSHFDFFLLVLATMMITAAGYTINDYFDLRIDRINKPHKQIIGRKISRRKAILIHSVLNGIALLIGFYLSYKVRNFQTGILFFVIALLLWLYSIRYKRKFLIGNVIVGVLSAFVIMIVWVFDYQAIIRQYGTADNLSIIFTYMQVYAFFAFFLTIIREIIKDIQDIKGDLKAGCRTIPIVIGVHTTKRLLIVLSVIMILMVGYFQMLLLQLEFDLLFAYVLIAVQMPFIFLIHRIHTAREKNDFHRLSRFSKTIMALGVLSMLGFYFFL